MFGGACRQQTPGFSLKLIAGPTDLRTAPGESGEVVARLDKGLYLRDLDETSALLSHVELQGQTYRLPWIKVITPDGQSGWIHAAYVRPDKNIPFNDWLAQKLNDAYLGKSLNSRRREWAARLDSLPTANQTDFEHSFRQAYGLRDTILMILHKRADAAETDFQWLSKAMPGFVFQRIDASGKPWLYQDYRFWSARAKRCPGELDDICMGAFLAAYPKDSIESPHPCWTMPMDPLHAYSNLGAGQHTYMLRLLDACSAKCGDLFKKELNNLKNLILNDILSAERHYWQSSEKIVAELREIVGLDLPLLKADDRLALAARLKMFENPAGNGIMVNVRAGE